MRGTQTAISPPQSSVSLVGREKPAGTRPAFPLSGTCRLPPREAHGQTLLGAEKSRPALKWLLVWLAGPWAQSHASTISPPASPSVYVCAKSLQLCPTLCDPKDCSLRGSSVLGVLQARTVE